MDMLINVVIEVDGCMPVFGEIQVHYRPILDLKVWLLCFGTSSCLKAERFFFS